MVKLHTALLINNMDPSPSTPERRTVPMDGKEMEALALTWIEKCIAIFPSLSYGNLAAALMLLRFIRPAASFFLVLVGDFSHLAVVLLRIIARHAEIAAGALEFVNEKYFGRDAKTTSTSSDVPTLDNDSENSAEVEQQRMETPQAGASSRRQEKINGKMVSGGTSASGHKKKTPETKKARGRAKIMELREKRLRMGLKVANKGDED